MEKRGSDVIVVQIHIPWRRGTIQNDVDATINAEFSCRLSEMIKRSVNIEADPNMGMDLVFETNPTHHESDPAHDSNRVT